jgi:hypothetical protein
MRKNPKGGKPMIDLLMFCCHRNAVMKTPATIGPYTYATDGKVIVRVPADKHYEAPVDFPLVDRLPWDHDQLGEWVQLPILDIKPRNCLACKGTGKTTVCPECEGEGEVCFSNDFNTYDFPCETCGGSRVISGGTDLCYLCRGTLQHVRHESFPWQRGKVNAHYVHLLKDLPGIQFSIHGEVIDPIRFRFDGGCGLLMPILK